MTCSEASHAEERIAQSSPGATQRSTSIGIGQKAQKPGRVVGSQQQAASAGAKDAYGFQEKMRPRGRVAAATHSMRAMRRAGWKEREGVENKEEDRWSHCFENIVYYRDCATWLLIVKMGETKRSSAGNVMMRLPEESGEAHGEAMQLREIKKVKGDVGMETVEPIWINEKRKSEIMIMKRIRKVRSFKHKVWTKWTTKGKEGE